MTRQPWEPSGRWEQKAYDKGLEEGACRMREAASNTCATVARMTTPQSEEWTVATDCAQQVRALVVEDVLFGTEEETRTVREVKPGSFAERYIAERLLELHDGLCDARIEGSSWVVGEDDKEWILECYHQRSTLSAADQCRLQDLLRAAGYPNLAQTVL